MMPVSEMTFTLAQLASQYEADLFDDFRNERFPDVPLDQSIPVEQFLYPLRLESGGVSYSPTINDLFLVWSLVDHQSLQQFVRESLTLIEITDSRPSVIGLSFRNRAINYHEAMSLRSRVNDVAYSAIHAIHCIAAYLAEVSTRHNQSQRRAYIIEVISTALISRAVAILRGNEPRPLNIKDILNGEFSKEGERIASMY